MAASPAHPTSHHDSSLARRRGLPQGSCAGNLGLREVHYQLAATSAHLALPKKCCYRACFTVQLILQSCWCGAFLGLACLHCRQEGLVYARVCGRLSVIESHSSYNLEFQISVDKQALKMLSAVMPQLYADCTQRAGFFGSGLSIRHMSGLPHME